MPPSTVVEDDANGDVEPTGVFDPAQDGLDFWESLEGMRLQVNDAAVVGPTQQFRRVAGGPGRLDACGPPAAASCSARTTSTRSG